MGESHSFGAFGKFVLGISSVPDDADIFSGIANHLLEFSNSAVVTVATFDYDQSELAPAAVAGDKSATDIISAFYHAESISFFTPIPDEAKSHVFGKPVQPFTSLSEATFGHIRIDQAQQLQTKLNFTDYQRLTMTADGRILGSILLIYSNNTQPLDPATAETIAHVCGLIVRERTARVDSRWLEDHYHDLIEMLPEAVFEADMQGKLVSANKSAFDSFGYTEEDVENGLNVVTFVSPEYIDQARRNIGRMLEQGADRGPTEYVMVRKDGTKFPALISTNVIVRDGVQSGLRGIIIDLSNVKKTESQKAQLEAAVEQSAEGIIITDSIARIQYANPSFLRLTGMGRDELIGKLPSVMGGEDDTYDGEHSTMWATLKEGGSWQGIISGARKDGTEYFLNANVNPVRGDSGVITNFVAAMRDVTYERELEERYRHAQKMEAIGRLAGGIAHDFNNLMTAIAGYTELIKETFAGDDDRNKDATEILEAVERATNLTGQLLAFSRKQVIQPKRLNLVPVLAKMRDMLQRLLGEDIDLQYDLEPQLPDLYIDPGQIEQIILNLAVNARDALAKGGRFSFRVYTESDSGKNFVTLVVQDSGKGMDEDTLSHIFEPFFTTKGPGEGTGLGLATVYGIVEQNNGTIAAHSVQNEGSIFTIRFPAMSSNQSLSEQPVEAPSPQKKQLIILVEDEELVRNLTAKVLRQSDYEVMAVESPAAAIGLVNKDHLEISMLITDVVMPGMTGKELADRLSVLQPGLKVLFMSGYTNEVISSRGIQNGSVPFLQKPFTPSGLMEKVHEILAETS